MDSQHQIKTTTTQQKEFQCPVCFKFFSRKFTLEMHFLIHQGVKPHACPFCGKCFRQKGTLMRHKALHSSTALFHCGLCNRSFRQKNVFLHHLKHRHKVSTENLDRRKWRTQIADGESLMNTLPSFASADSIAISTSDKNLENMLFNSYYTLDNCSQNSDNRNKSIAFNTNKLSNQSDVNSQENNIENSGKFAIQTITDKNFSDYFNKNIPQPNSVWQCNVCNYEIPFDYLTCSAHISLHEQKLKYKCCLCLKLFLTNTDYHQHMSLFHGNSKLLSKDNSSCSKFIISQNNIDSTNSQLLALPSTSKSVVISSENKNISKIPTTYFNNGEISKQPNFLDSHLMLPNKAETTFTCIPCQMDFSVEEDFECHVKTHVQSVLLSDSESLEIDDSNNNENTENISSGKIFHYSNDVSSNMLTSINDNNVKNLLKCLPSDIIISTETGMQNQLDNLIFHHNTTKASQNYDKNEIVYKSNNYKQEKIEVAEYLNTDESTFQVANSEFSCTKFKYCTNKDFLDDKVTGDSSSCIENSGLSTSNIKKNINFRQNSSANPSLYFTSKYLKSTHRKNKPLQKINSKINFLNNHPNILYLCPFCKKYFSSAERLCNHTMLHVRSVKPKIQHKTTTTVKKLEIEEEHELSKENYSYPLSLKKSIIVSSKPKSLNNAKIIQKKKSDKILSSNLQENFHQNARNKNIKISKKEIDSITTKWFKKDSQAKYDDDKLSCHNYFKCKQCKKTFSKKTIYYYHMQMHLKAHTFHCLICHKKFLYKQQLLRHSRTNHLKTFKCHFCSRVFQYNVLYRYHRKFCTSKSSFNDLKSITGDLSIPIIDILKISNFENLIGVIPITNLKKTDITASEKPPIMAAIPVLSPLRPYQIEFFPVIGNLPL